MHIVCRIQGRRHNSPAQAEDHPKSIISICRHTSKKIQTSRQLLYNHKF